MNSDPKFPADFAKRVIRQGRLEQRRTRRRLWLAATGCLALIAGIGAAGLSLRSASPKAPSAALIEERDLNFFHEGAEPTEAPGSLAEERETLFR